MIDLLVIHPGAAHGVYGSDLANSLIAVEPPLWARLIAGYVRDAGFNVQIIDAEADGLSPAEVASLSVNAKPRLGIHRQGSHLRDRKSTRLNSSHQIISYAVFCLKK